MVPLTWYPTFTNIYQYEPEKQKQKNKPKLFVKLLMVFNVKISSILYHNCPGKA